MSDREFAEEVFTEESTILNILALFKTSLVKRMYSVSVIPHLEAFISLKSIFTASPSGIALPVWGVATTVAV